MPKVIVSLSGGKDSTWMLLEMIRRGEHIDEVVFFDTGWEFPQMLRHVDRIKQLVESMGITFVTLYPETSFDYNMFDRPVCVGKPNEHTGYSWCGLKGCRWGTTLKLQTIDKYFKTEPDHIQCVGYDWEGLYEDLDRVSCKFCALKNLKELRSIYWKMPDVWSELRDYQSRTYLPYKGEGKSVFDLKVRFELEKEFEAQGKSIRSKEFFTELKKRLS